MPTHMSEERVIVLRDWPQPTVVAEPRIFADDDSLFLRYRSVDDKIVVVHFPSCAYLTFGAPNDEAMNGHPLYGHGLKHYSVHEVRNSSLIQSLERKNSVHPRHHREFYLRDKKHYIFTFQDSTLECVVNEGQLGKPTIKVCVTESDAEREWRRA